LKKCPSQGLFFPRDSPLCISGFSNADWEGCIDSRRSISSQCFFLGKSLISWRTKKQLIVSISSSEVEYRALGAATCELQWLLYLLKDLHVSPIKLPVLYCVNESALHIAANPVFHERTKHLEIDCHLVREKLQARCALSGHIFPLLLFVLVQLQNSSESFKRINIITPFERYHPFF
jgi:hypothetical protein